MILFKGLIHPFPNYSHKYILSRTEFGKPRCAALHHLLYSHFNPAPTWLARPKVLRQKLSGHGNNLGLSWELPVERLPTFPWIHPSCYALPYPTVKLLLMMPFHLTHLSQNSSFWDGLKTEKKKKRREAACFASWITPLRKANSVLIFSTIFSLSFLSSSTSLLYLPLVSLCKKRNQVRKKERWRTLI